MEFELGAGTNWYEVIDRYEELGLSDCLLKAITEEDPFNRGPRLVQRHALKPIINGRHVLVEMPCFADQMDAMIIGALQRIGSSAALGETQVLLLTAARELSDCVQHNGNRLGRSVNVKMQACMAWHLAPNFTVEAQALRDGVPVVIGTPGRIQIMIDQGNLRRRGIKMVVLHRADSIFERGLGDQFYRLLDSLPRDAQVVALCEGEMDGDVVEKMLTVAMKDAVRIVFKEKVPPGPRLSQFRHFYVPADDEADRLELLKAILESLESVAILVLCHPKMRNSGFAEAVAATKRTDVEVIDDSDHVAVSPKGIAQRVATSPSPDASEEPDEVQNHLAIVYYGLPRTDDAYSLRLSRILDIETLRVAIINIVTGNELSRLRKIERKNHLQMDLLPWEPEEVFRDESTAS